MSEYKQGQRVRVTIEGPVNEDSYTSGRGYTNFGIGDNDLYLNDPDYPEVKVTVEVLKPELKAGQVWRDGDRHWFATAWDNDRSPIRLWSGEGTYISSSSFFANYPSATLVFDPEASNG